MAKRVAIVGAGPGGLTAAMLLARAGLEVRVFEQRDRVGGRTSTLEGGGFTFDLGPTFFLYPQVLEDLFRRVGRNLHDEARFVRLDPQYELVYGAGGRLLCTPDVEEMERRIAKLCPRDRGGFTRWMNANRKKLALLEPALKMPFHGPIDALRLRALKALRGALPLCDMHRYLKRFFSDERLLLSVSFQSKYLGMSPFTCPSLFSILAFLEYEYGVFHPIGGCGAVMRAMGRVAECLGAEIRLNAPVESLLFEGRRAVGVRTADGEYRADAVVVNADFARAMMDLVPAGLRPRWTDERIASKRFSCSCFMIYLGIEGRYDHLRHHTIFICQDYRRNLREVEEEHALAMSPSFYVQNAAGTDDTLAPPGMSTLYILVPVTHCHPRVDWSAQRTLYRNHVIKELRHVGITDLESRIRFERVFTPDDWRDEQRIYLGATFNLAHNMTQMLHWRPRNRFEDLDGVYLAGGGTHPGSGLPVIFESARISSRLLLQDLGLEADWLAP